MTIKKDQVKDRLDRIEGKKEKIKKSVNQDIKISRKASTQPTREQQIRGQVEKGGVTNFYINKEDELFQRILIHIPFDLAESLRLEAFNAIPRKTFSEVVREKLTS